MQRMPRTASSVPEETAPEAIPITRTRPAPRAPVPPVEYGVEVGTTPDMNALRTRWLSVKANFCPLLAGWGPVAYKRSGSTQLRLMAGPLKSMTAAREVCAKFVAANGYCWPTRVNATDVVQR